ncbi:putative phage tail assembly chaperone [Pseudomonas cichorii]|nr:putative phage tail assembly chaperone [Pseudomonas cichorii]
MSEVNREVSLEYGDNEFTFNLTPQDITKYFNSVTQNNKVAPAHNLLMGTVAQDEKARLKPLLENPVTTMTIAGALLEEYSPDVDVIVKKSSGTLKA